MRGVKDQADRERRWAGVWCARGGRRRAARGRQGELVRRCGVDAPEELGGTPSASRARAYPLKFRVLRIVSATSGDAAPAKSPRTPS